VPTRHDAPLGAPCWIDLTSSDIERAQDFYGTVFGWTFESAGPQYGGYVNAAKDGHPVAGLMANRPESQTPDNWAIYCCVLDLADSFKGDASARDFGEDGFGGRRPHVGPWGVIV